MTTIQLAIFVPLAAGLLWVGLGALVSRIACGSDGRLPRLLWPVLGLAASIVLANGISRLGIVLPWNAIIIVALAAAGLWLERRALIPTRGQAGLALVAAGPAVIAFSGALLLAGPTITGYLIDTNTGVHSLGADFLLHHGGDFASIPRDSTDASMLAQFFVDSSYPSGAHAIYGLLGALTGASLTFVSTPFMGICLAAAALAVMAAARGLGIPPLLAAFTGFITTCGALVFAFALSSEIKEVVTLPLLAGMTAFVIEASALRSPRRLAVVAALLAAGLYHVIGVSAAAWAVPFILFLVLRALFTSGDEGLSVVGALRTLALTGALGLVLIGPLLPGLADQLTLASNLSQTNASLAADPGNLLGPIHKIQALGTWIGSDHRVAPNPDNTYPIIGITWLLIAVGVLSLLRERRWSVLIWFGGLVVLWVMLTQRGTLWLDSKLVMLNGIPLMLLAAKGATMLGKGLSATGGEPDPDDSPAAAAAALRRRSFVAGALGLAFLAPVIGGVISSDLHLYVASGTASNARYQELERIDERFAGQGRAYFSEFDEYAMYTLRNLHFVGAGYGDLRAKPTVSEPGFGYGQGSDSDRIPTTELQRYSLFINLRSPLRSAPGSDWTLVSQGRYFEVWKRDPAKSARIVSHLPVGAAVGLPKCQDVRKVAALAERENATLVARVAAAPTVAISPSADTMTPNWAASWSASISVNGAGRIVLNVPDAVQTSDHDFWLTGAVGRPLRVNDATDGRVLGTLERLAAGDGNSIGPVRVPAGTKALLISSTKRQIRPGDTSPTVLRTFQFEASAPPVLRTVDPADAESLCGQALDWIDVVRK